MNLSKHNKLDLGVAPVSIANGSVTGRYYSMTMYRRALAAVSIGAMAAGKTATISIVQATDDVGTDSQPIIVPGHIPTPLSAVVTANTDVIAATLTCATVKADDVVTVNGIKFTAAAAADLANRKFAVGADNTACAASLVEAINHATAGVPGITATSALGVVTLTVTTPGEKLITIADPSATITAATTQALAYIELNAEYLDEGYDYIAVKIDSTATGICSALLLRGEARFQPNQQVAASAEV